MTDKLKFLTKMSLNKKVKTKWFLIANLIFGILIVGLLNVDSIIKALGGVVLAVKSEVDVPVKLIGVGEKVEDLQDFNAKAFSEALFGSN